MRRIVKSKAGRSSLLIVGLLASMTLAGCQGEPAAMTPPPAQTPGVVRTTTTFDMTQGAMPEDIMAALNQNGRVAIRGNVVFATDSATLEPAGLDAASRLAGALQQNPGLNVAVVGHTDSRGDFKYNLDLSQRRAQAFARALVADGVSADRLAPVGVGPLAPVASNDTAEGQQMNRRIEIVVAN